MEKVLQTITVASLLHDVGKAYQRSGKEIEQDYSFQYCPKYQGRESHLHVAHTADFLHKFFESNKKIKKIFMSGDSELNLSNLACNHHNPSNKFDWIIAAADRLASGFERTNFEAYNKNDLEVRQQENYKKSRLLSIFSLISLTGNRESKESNYYPLKPLSFDIAPEKLRELSRDEAEREYKELLNLFEDDLKNFLNSHSGSFDDFLNGLTSLLEKYFWCIPSSSYKTLADVSLFDHLKTTAAIANSLFVYHYSKSQGDFSVEEIKNFDSDEEKFVFVKGDFSGIQNFIFSKFGESNKYAAKILRAKSLFVSVFTDTIAYLLCREFKVNSANIVISAGGHFLTVLPNIENAKETIEEFFKKVSLYLEKLTYGQTRFNYSYVFVSGYDFSSKNISQKMNQLNYNLMVNKLKLNPQINIFENYLQEVSNANGVCNIDGYSPKAPNSDYSRFSNYMKMLGENLPKNNYLIIHFGDISQIEISSEKLIPLFDNVYFTMGNRPYYSNTTLNFNLLDFKDVAVKRIANYIPVFKEEDLTSDKYFELPERIFDQSDFEVGKVKSFYHIAMDSRKPKDSKGEKFIGKSFLGVLKADVDNLGLIFSRGFDENTVSFAKIVSLSRMLDFFFTGWLPNILKEKYNSVYTVFAGGDDLFLIGSYTQIFSLARDISKHFKEYVKNDEIHLSAGIILQKPHVPVYQMAEHAEEKLDFAKKSGKNRVAVFNCVVKWAEYEKLLEMTKQFETYFDNYKLSTSYMYRLLHFIDMKESLDRAIMEKGYLTISELENAKWIALFTYSTYRNISDKEKREEVLTKLKTLIDEYGKNLLIPISLTLYQRRN